MKTGSGHSLPGRMKKGIDISLMPFLILSGLFLSECKAQDYENKLINDLRKNNSYPNIDAIYF